MGTAFRSNAGEVYWVRRRAADTTMGRCESARVGFLMGLHPLPLLPLPSGRTMV